MTTTSVKGLLCEDILLIDDATFSLLLLRDKFNSPVQILQHSELSSFLEHVTGHSLLEQFILPACRNNENLL